MGVSPLIIHNMEKFFVSASGKVIPSDSPAASSDTAAAEAVSVVPADSVVVVPVVSDALFPQPDASDATIAEASSTANTFFFIDPFPPIHWNIWQIFFARFIIGILSIYNKDITLFFYWKYVPSKTLENRAFLRFRKIGQYNISISLWKYCTLRDVLGQLWN